MDPRRNEPLQTCWRRLICMVMIGILLWKLSLTIRQPSVRMIRMIMIYLVERRFTSSWTSLKEEWYLPHYDGVALKAVWWLKGFHGTVSSEVCIQVVIVIYILRWLDKCDSDRLWMSDLNQRSCPVPTEPHRYIGDISEISPTAEIYLQNHNLIVCNQINTIY